MKSIGIKYDLLAIFPRLVVTLNERSLSSKKYLEFIKDIYKGKRCFVIGNGSGLNVLDLDRLATEYTFVSNRIYRIFP